MMSLICDGKKRYVDQIRTQDDPTRKQKHIGSVVLPSTTDTIELLSLTSESDSGSSSDESNLFND